MNHDASPSNIDTKQAEKLLDHGEIRTRDLGMLAQRSTNCATRSRQFGEENFETQSSFFYISINTGIYQYNIYPKKMFPHFDSL